MTKIIYIGYQPITSKFYDDFYIQPCLDNGYDVEYWDITQIYFPQIDFGIPFEFNGIIKFNSFDEIKKKLNYTDIKSTLFVVNITYELKVIKLFAILTKFNCTISYFGRKGLGAGGSISKYKKLHQLFFNIDLYRIIKLFKIKVNYKIATLLKQFKIIKPYNYIFQAGSEGFNNVGPAFKEDKKNAKIININFFDYDKYLKSLNEEPLINENYCVFLDEYLPYHPDITITVIDTVSAEKYYSELNNYFNFIERKLNLKVIIAAHPKAHNYKSHNPFDNRSIYFEKTCELVKNSKFVMTHCSTSISFAVLFKKPLLIINSSQQKERMSFLFDLSLSLAHNFNAKFIHFDHYDENENYSFDVDYDKMNIYKYKYLTSIESEGLKSSDIFINALSKIQ